MFTSMSTADSNVRRRRLGRLSLPFRLAAIGAFVGLTAALALFVTAWRYGSVGMGWLFVCPPSLGLMALDAAGPWERRLGCFIVALANATLYLVIGLFIGFYIREVIPPDPDRH